MNIGRTLRMLRHLRPSQVLHRLWYRARQPYFGTPFYRRKVLPCRPIAPKFSPPAVWAGDAANGKRIVETRTIRLIGLDGPIGTAEQWQPADKPLLWTFHLHYFDWLGDLVALGNKGAAPARALIASWLDAHDSFHPVAWHPYPLSLRLYSWLTHTPWLIKKAESGFRDRFQAALNDQASHLWRVLENDVGGNHLIKNLKAMVAAGLCLSEHERRLQPALKQLKRALERQILADGVHYERSPDYHLQVLCDLIDIEALFGVAGSPPPPWLLHTIEIMRAAGAAFRHGDGGLALFNDGTVGDARQLAVLPQPAPQGLDSFPHAGYWRLAAHKSRVLFDCGPCCPDDLPAHAHADTLSFEFSVGAHRLVVNGGTYAYQDPEWRNRLRGTAAHSAVTVDDADSAEVYGAFRLGARPRHIRAEAMGLSVEGAHDGYVDRFGVVHRRRLSLSGDGDVLSGEDVLFRAAAGAKRRIHARFHLHPSVEVLQPDDGEGVQLILPSGEKWRFTCAEGRVGVVESVYAPRFYEMHQTHTLRADIVLEGRMVRLGWWLKREKSA